MAAPDFSTIIVRFFNDTLDPILNVYITNGYNALANELKYPLGVAVVLFITLLGVSISQGWMRLSMSTFVKSSLRIGLIYMFAMNWGNFSEWVVQGIQHSAEQIGNWLLQATPVSIPHFGGDGIKGALQSVFIEVTDIGQWSWGAGSWRVWSPYFTALMIWGFGYTFILIGFFEIVLAKIMLAILFATAPLFIGFTLFKPTQSFFDRWLGMITGYAFLMIFVMAVLALALSFMQWAIADLYNTHPTEIPLMSFVPAMVIGFMGIGIVLKAAHMGQAIGGSVTIVSGTEMLSGRMGNLMSGTMSTLKMPLKAWQGFKNRKATAGNNQNSAAIHGVHSRLRRGE